MRNSILQYASEEMRHVWSPEFRVAVEREIWILIMQLQAKAGIDIPEDAISDYIQASDTIDLDRIRDIEKETKHDLRARLVAFNEAAGHTYAHYGLTSCDITDNAVLDLIRESAGHLETKAQTVLSRLRDHIEASAELVCVARTHNQPAQLSTVGKRFATVADELLACLGRLSFERRAMACRGLGGAVGTGMDLATLLGSPEAYRVFNLEFAQGLGYHCLMGSTGQVSHRSEDAAVAAAAVSLTAACANLARMVRLETGYGRMWETQGDDQVGSSAMPHKRNSITAERINGLANIAKGYYSMLSSAMGETWLEGDVSDSVTRRVSLPGLFCAVDAALVNTIALLERLDLSKDAYRRDVNEWSFVVRSGEILAAAVKNGALRDEAYEAIRAWATASRDLGVDPWSPTLRFEVPGLTHAQVFAIWESEPDLTTIQDQIGLVLEVIDNAVGQAG